MRYATVTCGGSNERRGPLLKLREISPEPNAWVGGANWSPRISEISEIYHFMIAILLPLLSAVIIGSGFFTGFFFACVRIDIQLGFGILAIIDGKFIMASSFPKQTVEVEAKRRRSWEETSTRIITPLQPPRGVGVKKPLLCHRIHTERHNSWSSGSHAHRKNKTTGKEHAKQKRTNHASASINSFGKKS